MLINNLQVNIAIQEITNEEVKELGKFFECYYESLALTHKFFNLAKREKLGIVTVLNAAVQLISSIYKNLDVNEIEEVQKLLDSWKFSTSTCTIGFKLGGEDVIEVQQKKADVD